MLKKEIFETLNQILSLQDEPRCIVSQDGYILIINKPAEITLGKAVPVDNAMSITNFIHPTDQEHFEHFLYNSNNTTISLKKNDASSLDDRIEVNKKKIHLDDHLYVWLLEIKASESDILNSSDRRLFLSLFEDSPIPIWDEDFSKIAEYIFSLQKKGIQNIRNYVEEHPEELNKFSKLLVVNNINQAVVTINEAESKQQVLDSFEELITEKSAEYMMLQLEAIANRKTSCEFDAELLTFKGNTRYVHFKWSVVKGFENDYSRVYLTTTDLTERIKEDNLILQQSNREKEILLKEIHHRVKNNLQIISSLIRLQSNNMADPRIQDILNVSLARISSMAKVHEMLYQSSAYSKINYKEYLESLIGSLLASLAEQKTISVDLQVDPIEITIETAIPLGLLINEILTNSLKHGFESNEKGHIYVYLRQESSTDYELKIGDNGKGFTIYQHQTEQETLGLSLIESLGQQLSGTILQVTDTPGTHYILRFKAQR